MSYSEKFKEVILSALPRNNLNIVDKHLQERKILVPTNTLHKWRKKEGHGIIKRKGSNSIFIIQGIHTSEEHELFGSTEE